MAFKACMHPAKQSTQRMRASEARGGDDTVKGRLQGERLCRSKCRGAIAQRTAGAWQVEQQRGRPSNRLDNRRPCGPTPASSLVLAAQPALVPFRLQCQLHVDKATYRAPW